VEEKVSIVAINVERENNTGRLNGKKIECIATRNEAAKKRIIAVRGGVWSNDPEEKSTVCV